MTEPRNREVFFQAVLDAMTEHVVVVDVHGAIHYVNRPWVQFCAANDGPGDIDWTAFNYLDVCDAAARDGDVYGRLAREGIEALAAGRTTEYSLEYPCDRPEEPRWFLAHMTALEMEDGRYIVISHHDITQRKLAEEKADALARTDGLTGVANRTHFEEFLDQQWRRALRSGDALSVLLLDVDFFKPFNDHYGHQAGDECLRRVAAALQGVAERASDLVARYGGEEFVIVLGQSSVADAHANAQRSLDAIRDLAIDHEYSDVAGVITVSIGVVTAVPRYGDDVSSLILAADEALYQAKNEGRDRVRVASSETAYRESSLG